MRPIGHVNNMAVFLRIDMDVIHMLTQVALVTNQMFPVATLPDAAFGFRLPAPG